MSLTHILHDLGLLVTFAYVIGCTYWCTWKLSRWFLKKSQQWGAKKLDRQFADMFDDEMKKG